MQVKYMTTQRRERQSQETFRAQHLPGHGSEVRKPLRLDPSSGVQRMCRAQLSMLGRGTKRRNGTVVR
eukprot:11325573-Heterocapsa_arctica.AAC.1